MERHDDVFWLPTTKINVMAVEFDMFRNHEPGYSDQHVDIDINWIKLARRRRTQKQAGPVHLRRRQAPGVHLPPCQEAWSQAAVAHRRVVVTNQYRAAVADGIQQLHDAL
jgi:hypothetical protein